MKKRTLSLLLALLTALTLMTPALARDDTETIFGNINYEVDEVGSPALRRITLKDTARPIEVVRVTTFHWNQGVGTDAPGKISIIEYTQQNGTWKQDQVVGTWNAEGRNIRGIENVYWDAYPDFVMLPGHSYVIKPSDTSTWSYNDASDGCGMFEVIGARLDNFNDAGNTNGNTGNNTLPNNFDNGYQCSGWALDEVRQADYIGIFPDSLRYADLTQPITRAEFAAVSVNLYVLLAQRMVEPYSPNPFTDTSDRDVLRAYAAQLTDGTGNGKFSPNAQLTREQGATMLARAYKHAIYPDYTLVKDDTNNKTYPLSYSRPAFFDDDGDISQYAYVSVNFMFENDIIKGVGNNRFGPQQTMTREQALAIAVRMRDNLNIGW